MKKIKLFFLLMLVSCLTLSAQSLNVNGKITYADDGEPVIGATIFIKGTTISVPTDLDGNYSISVPSNSSKVLIISATGLQEVSLPITESGVYNIAMKPDAVALEEVVITGYGNFTKKDYTGSASTVGTKRTKDVPSVSVQSRLEGAVPGVSISSGSGQPGAVESVRIRGMGSINAGNDPLYVIDGVPMYTGNASSLQYASSGNSVLASINPNDIENITVIKDAAAASLYGSRAANGVIIITTKRGKVGKTQFNAKASWGFSNMAIDWRPVLGGEETRDLWHHSMYNYARYKEGQSPEESIAYADKYTPFYYTEPWSGWTNWRDYLLRTGHTQQYEVSAAGGNDKTRFFTSLSYADMQGITHNSGYKRITGRLNVNHTAGRFTLEAGMSFSNTAQDTDSEGYAWANPMMAIAVGLSPAWYPYNQDGSINITEGFSFYGNALANPLQTQKYNYDKNTINRTMMNVSGKLDIIDGLAVKELLSYDLINAAHKVWWDPRTDNGYAANGLLQKRNVTRSTITSQTQLTYNKTFRSKHNVSALASFELENYLYESLGAEGEDYPSYLKQEIVNAGTKSGRSFTQGHALMSVVFDANYNYDNKYFIKGSYRRDGTSRLPKDARWGNFWAVSGSWRIDQEDWYKNGGISKILTGAKVRASYGVNGTQPTDYYSYMGLYGYGYNYNGAPGSTEVQMPNPALTWESNYATNLGVELELVNRVNITFDWYSRKTKDLILAKPISSTTGFGSIYSNVGSLRNRGFELDIRYNAIQTNDLDWTIGLNMGHNKNIVLSLADGQQEIQNGRWTHRVGESYYSFNLFEYAGVDPETGKEMYYTNTPAKAGQDFTIVDRTATTDATKVYKKIVGSWDPTVSGGITSNLTWKGLDFNFTFTYSIGGHCVDNSAVNYSNGSGWAEFGIAVPSYYKVEDMWKGPGDTNAKLPMYTFGGSGNEYTSTRFLFSTDYLRLKNLTLGYTLPKVWTSKIGFDRVRVYASGNNLFTVKDKDLYLDPETAVGGSISFETPNLRTISFGIEIGF